MDNGAGSSISTLAYDGRTNPSTLQAYLANLKSGSTYNFNVSFFDVSPFSSMWP